MLGVPKAKLELTPVTDTNASETVPIAPKLVVSATPVASACVKMSIVGVPIAKSNWSEGSHYCDTALT